MKTNKKQNLKLPIFSIISSGLGYCLIPLLSFGGYRESNFNNIFCGFKSRCKMPLAFNARIAPAESKKKNNDTNFQNSMFSFI